MTVLRWLAIPTVLAAVALCAPSGVSADTKRADVKPNSLDQATVGGNAFRNARGSIQVNESAGNANLQANVTVVSHGTTVVTVHQSTQTDAAEAGDASIAGNAFAGAFGAIQLNQSAGAGNAQGNVIVLQLGGNVTPLSDSALDATIASSHFSRQSQDSSGANHVGASNGAFANVGGVVQVNQTAGSANHTVNSFELQLQTGPGGN